jgi:ParB-like chromosome segregation protein Spo0J
MTKKQRKKKAPARGRRSKQSQTDATPNEQQVKPSAAQRHYEPHPLALAFPPMHEESLSELVEDIKQYGLRDSIVLYEDKILDGVQRYTACQLAKVKPGYVQFESLSEEVREHGPARFVISVNARRRHLTKQQIVEAIDKALKLENASKEGISHKDYEKAGRPKDEHKERVVKEAAKQGISKPTVEKVLGRQPDRPKIERPSKPKANPEKPKEPEPIRERVDRWFEKFCIAFTTEELPEAKLELVNRRLFAEFIGPKNHPLIEGVTLRNGKTVREHFLGKEGGKP